MLIKVDVIFIIGETNEHNKCNKLFGVVDIDTILHYIKDII